MDGDGGGGEVVLEDVGFNDRTPTTAPSSSVRTKEILFNVDFVISSIISQQYSVERREEKESSIATTEEGYFLFTE